MNLSLLRHSQFTVECGQKINLVKVNAVLNVLRKEHLQLMAQCLGTVLLDNLTHLPIE